MALYRETATGFVQEYASNPGAGYTLISTMPTTSINARAEWWRDVDKWNQTSAWHPSLASDAQDPNDNFLQIVFTNDSALVSSDADGNVTDAFLGATTQVRVMRGSQNVTLTEGWSFGLAKSPDVPAFTYTWTGTDVRTLQITGFPTDTTSGYIRITATRTGSTTQVKDFKFLKVIRGADGSSGVVIDLSNEAHVVPTDGNGSNGNFTGCNTTASIFVGSTDTSASWTWTATPSAGLSGTASNSNRTYTVSALSVDTGTVTFVATRAGFPNQTAIFSVSKAKGGVTYQIEPSVGAINKSAAGVYTPSAITFSSYRTTTTTREAFSTYFYIERQTSLGGAWTLVYQSSAAQTSYSYSIPEGTFGVRGSIYLTVGQYLDVEAVPVVFDGVAGDRGSRQFVFSGTSWSDTAAWDGIVTATGGNPVLTDLVTIADAAAGFSQSKFCTSNTSRPGTWVQPDSYINGNLLVTGTLGADRIAAGTIGAHTINLNGASSILQSTGFVSGTTGWQIKGNGTAEFQNVTVRGSLNAADLNNGGITTLKIGDLQVTTAKIDALAVTEAKIDNLAVTNAKISSLDGGKITANSIVADKIDTRNLTIKDAAGTTIFSAGVPLASTYIASLTADKISSGTISAATINLNTASSVIKTSTFALGTGFRISGDGTAFFYGASVSGSARSVNWNGTIDSGTGQPTAGTGTAGWCIDNAGNAEFNTVMVRTKNIENNSVTEILSGGNSAIIFPAIGEWITFTTQSLPANTYRGAVIIQWNVSVASYHGQGINVYLRLKKGSTVVAGFTGANGSASLLYIDSSPSAGIQSYTFEVYWVDSLGDYDSNGIPRDSYLYVMDVRR